MDGGPAILALPTQLFGTQFDEAPNRHLPPGGNHKILRRVLLQHAPLHFHVIAGMAPIPQ